MVDKFGSYGICQVATTNIYVPNQGVFCHGYPVNFCFCVKPFGTEQMAPLTKITMNKMPSRGQNLAWPKNLF